jgi:hypothetical protein
MKTVEEWCGPEVPARIGLHGFVRAIQADARADLEAALRAVEWGSCDGCNSGGAYCVICHEPRKRWDGPEDEDGISGETPGKHEPDCIVGLALAPEAGRRG